MKNPLRKAKKEEPVKSKDDLFAWATLRYPNGPICRPMRATQVAKAAGQWVVRDDQEEIPND